MRNKESRLGRLRLKRLENKSEVEERLKREANERMSLKMKREEER